MQFRLVRHFTLTSLAFIVAAGAALGLDYREIAIPRMLQQQESTNVNLTRIFANTLWQRHFSGLLKDSVVRTSPELKLLSQIPEIHREALALMRGSTTYKIYEEGSSVRNHGGHITVTSRAGQGTRFTVPLPVDAPDAVREH